MPPVWEKVLKDYIFWKASLILKSINWLTCVLLIWWLLAVRGICWLAQSERPISLLQPQWSVQSWAQAEVGNIISKHPDHWPEIPLLSIFWRSGLENVKITHFQVPKKWDFKRPNPKTETTPLEKNGGLDICFCVYHFWLRNEQILNILTSFSTKCWPSQKTPGKMHFLFHF